MRADPDAAATAVAELGVKVRCKKRQLTRASARQHRSGRLPFKRFLHRSRFGDRRQRAAQKMPARHRRAGNRRCSGGEETTPLRSRQFSRDHTRQAALRQNTIECRKPSGQTLTRPAWTVLTFANTNQETANAVTIQRRQTGQTEGVHTGNGGACRLRAYPLAGRERRRQASPTSQRGRHIVRQGTFGTCCDTQAAAITRTGIDRKLLVVQHPGRRRAGIDTAPARTNLRMRMDAAPRIHVGTETGAAHLRPEIPPIHTGPPPRPRLS